jgi:hypothetical protein
MERDVVSARFPSPLRNGDTDREKAPPVAFAGSFPHAQCGLARFTESMGHSINERLLTATVPCKARGTDNSGAHGMRHAPGQATYVQSGSKRS